MAKEIYFSTFRDESGGYRGYVDFPDQPRKYIRRKTEKEVKRRIQEIIDQYKAGDYSDPSALTVGDAIADWLESRKPFLSPTTYPGYDIYIRTQIKPSIGRTLIQAKDLPIKISKLYAGMAEKGYAHKTIRQVHAILHKFFKDMMRPPMQIIKYNPCDLVELPTQAGEKFQAPDITPKDFIKLLDKAKGTRHYMPVLLAGGLGLRRGEVFALRWSDIDFTKSKVHVAQSSYGYHEAKFKGPKSKASDRTFTMPGEISRALREHRAAQKIKGIHDLVITMPDGSPVKPAAYSHSFLFFLRQNKLKHIRFHDLRHFNATMMILQGVDVKTASKRLGHSTVQITLDLYQNVLDSMDKAAAKKINGIFPGVKNGTVNGTVK
jgi:integrase